jgi:K+-transporting ATPase ATPase C chain
MLAVLRASVCALFFFTVLTGLVYPAVVTLAAEAVFPAQAEGSLIRSADGSLAGSSLIGQGFTEPGYFWSRPSATAPFPYNAAASSGSNLGPLNPALTEAVEERVAALRSADPANDSPVPVDLVTASASGLDPHISPAAAAYQADRVARARGIDRATVERLIQSHTHGRTFGILGEPRVHVLELNRALDAAVP